MLWSVIKPSVFPNWCLSKSGFYYPTGLGDWVISFAWWLLFQRDGSQVLNKDIPEPWNWQELLKDVLHMSQRGRERIYNYYKFSKSKCLKKKEVGGLESKGSLSKVYSRGWETLVFLCQRLRAHPLILGMCLLFATRKAVQ